MSKPARISYVIMAVLLALVGLLHLGTLAFTTLFGYFALCQFSLGRSKALGVVIYVIAVTAIGVGCFTVTGYAATSIAQTLNFSWGLIA